MGNELRCQHGTDVTKGRCAACAALMDRPNPFAPEPVLPDPRDATIATLTRDLAEARAERDVAMQKFRHAIGDEAHTAGLFRDYQASCEARAKRLEQELSEARAEAMTARKERDDARRLISEAWNLLVRPLDYGYTGVEEFANEVIRKLRGEG